MTTFLAEAPMWFGQKIYYRGDKKTHGRWNPYETYQEAWDDQCTLISVLELCMSKAEFLAWQEANPKGRLCVPFRGGFFADFDDKDDLGSLHQKLVRILWDMKNYFGLREKEIRLWFSGSKGFHLIIPAEVFSPPGFKHPHLPTIYREFARALTPEFDGLLDDAVYSEGKGRLWRSAGLRRPNGMRKIPLTLTQLTNLSLHQIKKMSAGEEHIPEPPTIRPRPVPELFELFYKVVGDLEYQRVERVERTREKKERAAVVKPGGESTHTQMDVNEIRDLLTELPEQHVHEYGHWVRVGMAIHNAAEGEDWGCELWREWSQQSPKYNARDLETAWRSFRPTEGGVTIGTLKFLARQARENETDDA